MADTFRPVPKPEKRTRNKNSRHQSNPAPTVADRCIVCGAPYAETHEAYGGSMRNLSRKYGLTFRLCHEHHQGTAGVHGRDGLPLREWIQKEAQRMFEERHGSREDFIRLFVKSNL